MSKGLKAFLLVLVVLLYLGGVWIFVVPTVETITQDIGTAKAADSFVEKTAELREQYRQYKEAVEEYIKEYRQTHADPQPSQEGQDPAADTPQPGESEQNGEIIIPDEIRRTMPYEALYEAMKAYNERISENQQAALTDVFSFSEADFDPTRYGVEDGIVASIYIEGIDKSFPVYIGATSTHLANGVAVLSNTSMPTGGMDTNTVIAGHRGWSNGKFLKDIENVKQGTYVELTTFWEVLRYEVKEIRVIMPYELENIMLQKGRELLTIATCHPYGSGGRLYRYLVICERVYTSPEQADAETTSVTSVTAEEPVQTSPGYSLRETEKDTGIKWNSSDPAILEPVNVSNEINYESSKTEILVTDVLTYAGLSLFILFPFFAAVMLKKPKKRK